MSKRINIQGRTFGKLTVLKYLSQKNTHAVWQVECSCGKITEATYSNLISGNTTSCGSHVKKTHGLSNTKLYKRWEGLLQRDSLCEEWKSIEVFYSDVYSTFNENYSLSREDRNKPHSYDNSFWLKRKISKNIPSERVYFERKLDSEK